MVISDIWSILAGSDVDLITGTHCTILIILMQVYKCEVVNYFIFNCIGWVAGVLLFSLMLCTTCQNWVSGCFTCLPCLINPEATNCNAYGTDRWTACGHGMAYRKWKETKVHPGTAGPGNMLGCSLVSFHFLWAIPCPQAVYLSVTNFLNPSSGSVYSRTHYWHNSLTTNLHYRFEQKKCR